MVRQVQIFAADCGCPVLLAPCTLCWDGSSITKPDEVIDIDADGVALFTCQVLNDGLVSIPNDSRSCHLFRSAAGVDCGCSVYGDPCTMCKGGASMSKPKQEFVATVGATAIQNYLSQDRQADRLITCGQAEHVLSVVTAWTVLWVS